MLVMSKEIRINVRTTEEIKEDVEVTARLRGLTVSALVNSLVVKAIREEKERDLKAFEEKKRKILQENAESSSINGKELAPKSKKKMPLKGGGEKKEEKAA